MIVLERGPYGPTVWECPDCEGGGEMADPCCQGATCCERCDGTGEVRKGDEQS
jgi:hypothetical protein